MVSGTAFHGVFPWPAAAESPALPGTSGNDGDGRPCRGALPGAPAPPAFDESSEWPVALAPDDALWVPAEPWAAPPSPGTGPVPLVPAGAAPVGVSVVGLVMTGRPGSDTGRV